MENFLFILKIQYDTYLFKVPKYIKRLNDINEIIIYSFHKIIIEDILLQCAHWPYFKFYLQILRVDKRSLYTLYKCKWYSAFIYT